MCKVLPIYKDTPDGRYVGIGYAGESMPEFFVPKSGFVLGVLGEGKSINNYGMSEEVKEE